jgi:hypothetical protein
MMSAISFARISGLDYVHTPFRQMWHADRPMPEWVKAWEQFFSLGDGECLWDGSKLDAVDYSRHSRDLWLCFGWCGREQELFSCYRALLPEFRRRFYRNKRSDRTDELTVAVHVRRGDALPYNDGYYTSDESIRRTVTAVQSLLDSRGTRYRLRLFSQGKRSDFGGLEFPGAEFFLDADPLWTLREMIDADVFIMAKGCFSGYAGWISQGIKIGPRQPEWLYPLTPENWIECLPDGSFDCTAFERELSLVMSSKACERPMNYPSR